MTRTTTSSSAGAPRTRAATCAALLAAGTALTGLALPAAPAAAAGCPVTPAPTFAAPTYVDTTRAGGEPLIQTHPSGRLLYSSHAGTTHFFTPASADEQTAAFAQNYTGQTYIYYSDDNGTTWNFVNRALPTDGGTPASGFSDPEFAIDSAGGIFFSEINLANVATSASSDGGTTFTQKNFTGAILTDRQWMAADRPNEYYFVANSFGGSTGLIQNTDATLAHYLAKTTDGGATFTSAVVDEVGGSGLGDIHVDQSTGTLYEAHYGGGTLSMAAFREARDGVLTATDTNPIAEGVSLAAHWPDFDVDADGNLYITWDEDGSGDRPAGIWYASSADEGRTWTAPLQIADGSVTRIWPWIAVGDAGNVGIAWLEADVALPNYDAETPGDHGWRLVAAESTSALGCGAGTTPSFGTATMTPDPVHNGTICQGGTTCQAAAIDRRLGDYFSVDVDSTGALYAGYSDTAMGGGVALPGFVRQSGGPSLVAAAAAPVVPETPVAVLLPLAALAGVALTIGVRRRRA